jgi:hypothetical protein
MSVFSAGAKNTMLDALTPNQLQLHDGDPGAAGTTNRVGGANGEEAATFAAASGAERALSTAVEFTGLTASQSVTWFSVWNTSGPTFLGKGQITAGDVAANAAGEYTLTTGTKLVLSDPA